MMDAEHGEASPKSSRLVISPLCCSLIGETQIVYISPDFFMATLFLPQSSSRAEKPHPLIVEYLNAAKTFQGIKQEVEIKILS
jgi:hypothetical protein